MLNAIREFPSLRCCWFSLSGISLLKISELNIRGIYYPGAKFTTIFQVWWDRWYFFTPIRGTLGSREACMSMSKSATLWGTHRFRRGPLVPRFGILHDLLLPRSGAKKFTSSLLRATNMLRTSVIISITSRSLWRMIQDKISWLKSTTLHYWKSTMYKQIDTLYESTYL